MKRALLLIGLFAVMLSTACAQSNPITLNWLTNLEDAKELATEKNVPILVNFTGSDWCGWCFKIRDEIFLTKRFEAYSNEKLILVEIDFPKNKKQNESTITYNRQLAQKYNIKGFPTLIILDAEGIARAQMGYVPGGSDAFISQLESALY